MLARRTALLAGAIALVVLMGVRPAHAAEPRQGPVKGAAAGNAIGSGISSGIASGIGNAQGSATGTSTGLPMRSAPPLACLIEPNRVIELGSPVIGTIEETVVERGQRVRKGDVIARLSAGIERSALQLARTKMEADAELAAAQSNLDLARRKFERTESLVQQNFLSAQALDQARTDVEIAERTVARAREQRRMSEREWELARAQLDQRVIRSPIDGVVVEKYLSAGERVDERPIVRLAAVNPLRVEVIVPATHYNKFQPGVSGMVLPDLPQAEAREAKVVLVDKLIDSASNTFRVRMLLENKNNALPAGVRCKVSFAVLDSAQMGTQTGTQTSTQSSKQPGMHPSTPGAPATAPSAEGQAGGRSVSRAETRPLAAR